MKKFALILPFCGLALASCGSALMVGAADSDDGYFDLSGGVPTLVVYDNADFSWNDTVDLSYDIASLSYLIDGFSLEWNGTDMQVSMLFDIFGADNWRTSVVGSVILGNLYENPVDYPLYGFVRWSVNSDLRDWYNDTGADMEIQDGASSLYHILSAYTDFRFSSSSLPSSDVFSVSYANPNDVVNEFGEGNVRFLDVYDADDEYISLFSYTPNLSHFVFPISVTFYVDGNSIEVYYATYALTSVSFLSEYAYDTYISRIFSLSRSFPYVYGACYSQGSFNYNRTFMFYPTMCVRPSLYDGSSRDDVAWDSHVWALSIAAAGPVACFAYHNDDSSVVICARGFYSMLPTILRPFMQVYSSAYNAGYAAGVSDTSDEMGNDYGNGYNGGYADGYRIGYNKGYYDGSEAVGGSGTIFNNLFMSVLGIPIDIFNGLTPLAIWNTPIISIVLTFLFLGVIVWIVRKII